MGSARRVDQLDPEMVRYCGPRAVRRMVLEGPRQGARRARGGWHPTPSGAFLIVGVELLLVCAADAFLKVRAFVCWVGSTRPWDDRVFVSLEQKINAMVNQRTEYTVFKRLDEVERTQRERSRVGPGK